ncbi:MAG: hypothetical protein UU87_C0003G0145 [Parcubacteria group bacterium GW2011_GWA2_42_11]|nr:MAG: hypothetical protein UU87_C0003G0145 [Parcubacteria group bacterium GW2011_GWA2_42_11]KKT76475.1 MAG: hypothetical protein UW72_C0005G0043 [Parcubacteria group bacterium GW2011_GWF2_44_7]
MAIEIKKKEREPVSFMLRRFSRKVQQSRVLLQAREGRFYKKSKTKRQKKISALRREQLRGQRREMLKAGTLEEGQLIPKDMIKIKK